MKRIAQFVFVGLIGLAILVGKTASSDLVVLKTRDVQYQDFYTTLWAIEEDQWMWLRAVTPQSPWLHQITPGMVVEIQRDGEAESYEATVIRDPRIREQIDGWMRQKYGVADRVRELFLGSVTVPVKLVPVDEF